MRNKWLIGGLAAILVVGALGFFYGGPLWQYLGQEGEGGVPAEKTEEAIGSYIGKVFVPGTRQVYSISQAAEIWPKLLEATIDPPDVHVGAIQKLTVVVQSPSAIVSVEARTQLDTEFKVIPLKLVGEVALKDLAPTPYYVDKSGKLAVHPSGNIYARGPEGLPYAEADEYPRYKYEAEWKVYDTHDTTYVTEFVAKDASGRENSVTFAWSDQCGIPVDGTWTSTADCTLAEDDGVERGNVNLGSLDDINLNGNAFGVNPGYDISIGTGSFIIPTNSYIAFDYIWANDNDSDGYIDENASYARIQTTDPGAGWDRRYTKTGFGDCADTDANRWRYLSGYTDADGDGYGAGNSVQACSGSSLASGYVSNNTDCLDTGTGASTVWELRANMAQENDGDKYITGSIGNICVGTELIGAEPHDYFRNAAGTQYLDTASGFYYTGDCNDSNIHTYRNIASLVLDADLDGYYTGSSGTQCVGNQSIDVYGTRDYYSGTTGVITWMPLADARGGSDCSPSDYDIGFTSGATGLDNDADGIIQEAALHSECVGALYNVTNGREYYRAADGCYRWARGFQVLGYNDAADGTTCRTCGGQATCTE